MLNFAVFGAPGSGKGTQSLKLGARYGLKHISTGELFRKEIQKNSHIGQYVRHFVENGQLIPDATVMKEVYRVALIHRYARGYILDGFPRTLHQAEMLDVVLKKKKEKLNLVIYIFVDEEILIQRLSARSLDSERSDDRADIIAKRMDIYKELTFPVIDYYRSQGKLVEINGMRPVRVVFADICKYFDQFFKQ